MDATHRALVAAWIAVQLLGMLAAWGSRLNLGRRTTASLRLVLFSCLLAVAGLSWATGFEAAHMWVLSSATLGVMIVASVCDFRTDAMNPTLDQFLALYEG